MNKVFLIGCLSWAILAMGQSTWAADQRPSLYFEKTDQAVTVYITGAKALELYNLLDVAEKVQDGIVQTVSKELDHTRCQYSRFSVPGPASETHYTCMIIQELPQKAILPRGN